MIPLCLQGIQGINIVESHSVILILTKIAGIGRVGTVKMWESWDTMGELGHGHGHAQLSHIGRVGPCNDDLFYP